MRRADRLFQIVQRLRARRLTTASQLAMQLQVSDRTIYRDIRDLSLSGIPIRGEAGVGYALDPSFELTPLMFTPNEVETIVVGLRMASAFGSPELQAAVEPALDKIALALPPARRVEMRLPSIFAPAVHSDNPAQVQLDSLRRAIAERLLLTLRYVDLDGKESQRAVRPLALYFWGSVWTLAAWCHQRQDFRTFRVDRLQDCSSNGDRFELEQGRELDDYLRQQMARGPHPPA